MPVSRWIVSHTAVDADEDALRNSWSVSSRSKPNQGLDCRIDFNGFKEVVSGVKGYYGRDLLGGHSFFSFIGCSIVQMYGLYLREMVYKSGVLL